MAHSDPAVFIGKSRSKFFRDFIVEDNFFLVLEAEGVEKIEGRELIKNIKSSRDNGQPIISMQEFESWIDKALLSADMPAGFSAATGIVNGNIMYIHTIGEGEIHLRRGKDFVRVIHGNKSASGFVKEGDVLVLTTSTFRELIEEEEKLKPTMDKDIPEKIVKVLEKHYEEVNDKGSVAVFVEMLEDDNAVVTPSVKHTPNYHSAAVMRTEELEEGEDDDMTADEEDDQELTQRRNLDEDDSDESEEDDVEQPRTSRRRKFGAEQDMDDSDEDYEEPVKKKGFVNPFAKMDKQKRSKMITMGVLGVILVIFVWSVVFGYQRRQASEARKKIDTVTASVNKKTVEAEEIAFLNIDQAVALLNESKAEVKDLRASIGKGYAREIDGIEAKITAVENSIIQKDVQEPEEFYDLALEQKNAKGDVMFLEENKIAILDKANNTIYNFDADKKSLEKSSNSAVGNATVVGMVKGALYFFAPGKGLYSFTDDTKVKEVIKNDSDWGTIADIAFYGGNVYMLDSKKGDVYKYMVIASGYGDKSSYFSGSTPNISSANSIKIDSAVYIGSKSDVFKFTRGAADDFNMGLPDKDVQITDIYTDEDTEKVFAWDKKHGTIYILSKTGQYDRQINASILGKATDFVVYKDQILVLSGSKIYKLSDEGTGSTGNDETEDN